MKKLITFFLILISKILFAQEVKLILPIEHTGVVFTAVGRYIVTTWDLTSGVSEFKKTSKFFLLTAAICK